MAPGAVPSSIRRRLRPGRWLAGICMALCVADAAWAVGEAGCPEAVLESLAAEFDAPKLHAAAQDDGTLAAQACKPWPYDESITLAAVAYPEAIENDWGGRTLRLLVAMVATADGHVLAGHSEQRDEDAGFALTQGNLRLDTARYDLASGVRAFGLVVQSSAPGPSCPDGRFNDELILFVRDGASLRPVFGTYLSTWERVAGEPCSLSPQSRVVTEEAELAIGVEPTVHHGFADLRVMANVVRHEWNGGGDAEWKETTRRRVSRVVRYDGGKYAVDSLDNGFFWSKDNGRK